MNTDDLIIDCFAGGGGASTGIEAALGRPIDIGCKSMIQMLSSCTRQTIRTHYISQKIFSR